VVALARVKQGLTPCIQCGLIPPMPTTTGSVTLLGSKPLMRMLRKAALSRFRILGDVWANSRFSLLYASPGAGSVGAQPSVWGSGLRPRGVGQVNERPGTMAALSRPTM